MTAPQTTHDRDLSELVAELDGALLLPGEPGFAEEIATFNLAVQHSPAVVVAAASAADVAAAVRYAAARDLPVGVQATGHGAFVPVDGLLVSTRQMTSLAIDPVAGTATIGAGVKWRAVIDEAAEHGLAPPNGSSSDVGAVGYTVGGGLPVLSRTFGFAADHVRSLQVVTADGAIRRADAQQEPELFWALRGGKGNAGVVTEMTIDLMPLRRIYGGGIFYPGSAAAAVLRAFQAWCPTLPDTTTASLALLRVPELPDFPEPLRGQFVVHLRMAHVGDTASGERLVAPMRTAAPVVLDEMRDMPYTEVDSIHHDPEHPLPAYERCALLAELSSQAIDTLLEIAGPQAQTPVLMFELRLLGGALARPPKVPNAVGCRDAAFAVFVLSVLMPEIADIVPPAIEGAIAALAPYTTGRTFVNTHGYPGDAADRARPWPPDIYARLCRVKASYDPANLFRFGHAVTPTTETT